MKPRMNYSPSVDREDQVFLAAFAPSVDLTGASEAGAFPAVDTGLGAILY